MTFFVFNLPSALHQMFDLTQEKKAYKFDSIREKRISVWKCSCRLTFS